MLLAEFTYNAAKHKAIGMAPFEADIGYIPRLLLDLLAPNPRRLDSEEGLAYAEKLSKILRMLRERMEETQVAMTAEACWNCFSPLRRGAPVEASPQQRRRQQRCGEQWHSNGSGKGILATTAWHSLIAASLAFFLLFFFIDFHIALK